MKPLGHVLIDLLEHLRKIVPVTATAGGIFYAETGTTKDRFSNPPTEPADARSTLAVARWFAQNPERFGCGVTIDLHDAHLQTCKQVLQAEGIDRFFRFWCAEGDVGLQQWASFQTPIHLLLLDSDSCPNQTYKEFCAGLPFMAPEGSFIVIDDINRNGVNKGARVLAEPFKATMWTPHVAVIPIGEPAVAVCKAFRG